MANFFFYGTLCHAPLLDLVLGRAAAGQPAHLPDHAVFWAEGGAFPLIVAQPGGQAEGVLLTDLTEADGIPGRSGHWRIGRRGRGRRRWRRLAISWR